MQRYWIWLSRREKLGGELRMRLLEQFESPKAIFEATAVELADFPQDAQNSLLDKDLTEAAKIESDCEKQEIQVIPLGSPEYPKRLAQIFDPPLVLYCRGTLPELENLPTIAVVGTRKPGIYGQENAYRLGYELGQGGAVVVSGLALGIDAAGMHGCIASGGECVGVLGCGVEQVYPKKNQWLFDEVLHHGCLISEYPPGEPPLSWHFPQRNRIISGLSCGVVVVEAPEKSGALITARQALDQGRDVFAVPGNIDMPGFVGSNRLLRAGAIAVSTGQDILSEYASQFPGKIHQPVTLPGTMPPVVKVAQAPCIPEKQTETEKKKTKKSVDNGKTVGYSDKLELLSGLKGEEKTIAQALLDGERLVDDVIAETGIPSAKVLATLTLMEIKGVVKRLPGRHIMLKKL